MAALVCAMRDAASIVLCTTMHCSINWQSISQVRTRASMPGSLPYAPFMDLARTSHTASLGIVKPTSHPPKWIQGCKRFHHDPHSISGTRKVHPPHATSGRVERRPWIQGTQSTKVRRPGLSAIHSRQYRWPGQRGRTKLNNSTSICYLVNIRYVIFELPLCAR